MSIDKIVVDKVIIITEGTGNGIDTYPVIGDGIGITNEGVGA